jgi:predicted nuclease of predicted toxin-antitoxin system
LAKILVDENVPRDVREWLSKKGFETINVSEIHLKSAKDNVIAEYAVKNKMAIITLDKGFAKVYRTFQKGALGVIIIKANPPTPINIIETLSSAQNKLNLKETPNKLVIVSKKKIRIIT